MSIQPSLSQSRKPQPAPTVSGRYHSGERPLVCVQLILVAEGDISSKAGVGGGNMRERFAAKWLRPKPKPKPEPASNCCRKGRGGSDFQPRCGPFNMRPVP